MKKLPLLLPILLMAACGPGDPAPMAVVPTPAQVRWQQMETNMFVHFGPNTFSGKEWGDGTEAEDMFNPSAMDCRQWAATAAAAGFKGIIITAKHHDGFCLWPNPVSTHTVAQSKWMDGKGDVLKALSEACKEYGLQFGIYISPWDRNDPHYGTPEYNDVFVKTLQSALGDYGPVFEQWFDGANGEGPNGKRQEYDWPLFHRTVRSLQPDAQMFSDVGPGCRWVGNEEGRAGRTNWSTLNVEGFSPGAGSPPVDTLNRGNRHGQAWIPAETDVSIRPGWFWRESENGRVKSLQQLLQIYYESVGRNSLMLLNVPPDTLGRIYPADSARLREFRAALDRIFARDLAADARLEASAERGSRYQAANLQDARYDRFWAVPDEELTPTLTVTFPEERTFNRVLLQEYIPLGQRVSSFAIDVLSEGQWKEVAAETTIGYKRIVLIPETTAQALRIRITGADACPVLNNLGVYQDSVYQDIATAPAYQTGTVHPAAEAQTLDLGAVREIRGFRYAPIYRGEGGVITRYRLEGSRDGRRWIPLREGMFGNIVNNPIPQDVPLGEGTQVRYLRLTPVETVPEGSYGIAALEAL
ncbi:MAG: alpha-L-fucosidase [Bacteroidales bacterium]|nr:alpha-L-fucosidase [Bacteroidales bacterium]